MRRWGSAKSTGATSVAGEQLFIGLTTSGLCAVGLVREAWFLNETKKGRRLVQLCGTRIALWVLRLLLLAGVLFGLALAAGMVNPVRWSGNSENSRDRAVGLIHGLKLKTGRASRL